MRTLRQAIGMLNLALLFAMLAVMFVVGILGEKVKSLFTKVSDTEITKQPFESLARDFGSFSKPALY